MDFTKDYVKPATDSTAVYDFENHRWSLSFDEGKKIYDKHFEDAYVQKRLVKSSRLVYQRFYAHFVNSANKDLVEWILSCTKQGKDVILDALRAQADYDSESGGVSVSSQSSVDTASGLVVDREAMKAAMWSPDCEEILQFPVCNGVMLTKSYDFGIRLPENKYEKWEY